MKEIYKNSIIFIVLIIVLLFSQNILIFLGNINKNFLKDNNTEKVEIEMLKKENEQLKTSINKLNTIVSINNYAGFDYEISTIIVRDVYQIYETITIEKGENFAIKKGMAVVNENGLVGIISKVNKKSCQVRLITSRKTDISIKVGNAYGILSGYKDNYLIGSKISNYDDFNVGDLVYTSGLGNLPDYILIGKVKEIKPGDYNIEQQIYIEPQVNLKNLKYLLIIKNIKEV